MSGDGLTARAFRSLVTQRFSVRTEDGFAAQLVLSDCSEPIRAGGFESFTLTFSGGPDGPPAQGTFLLSAETFAESAVFLVPVGHSRDGLEYQAVFNQRVEEEN